MRAESGTIAFSILGRPFRASHVPPALADWLRASWHFPEHAPAPDPYDIDLEVVAAAPATPIRGAEHHIEVPGRVLRFVSEGNAWEMGDRDAGLRLVLDDTRAGIRLWGVTEGEASAPLYLALSVALSEALRLSGLLPLHAAAAARGDAGVAWLGASGAGKSTTLLLAVRAGWQAVAEDLCWLEPESLQVHGWDRGVRAWPDTIERFFPEWNDAVAMSDGKCFISYDRLGGGHPRSCTLTRLVLLGRDPSGPSRWEPASALDGVRALWEASGLPLLERSRSMAGARVAGLLGRVPVARLVRGTTELPLDGGA